MKCHWRSNGKQTQDSCSIHLQDQEILCSCFSIQYRDLPAGPYGMVLLYTSVNFKQHWINPSACYCATASCWLEIHFACEVSNNLRRFCNKLIDIDTQINGCYYSMLRNHTIGSSYWLGAHCYECQCNIFFFYKI